MKKVLLSLLVSAAGCSAGTVPASQPASTPEKTGRVATTNIATTGPVVEEVVRIGGDRYWEIVNEQRAAATPPDRLAQHMLERQHQQADATIKTILQEGDTAEAAKRMYEIAMNENDMPHYLRREAIRTLGGMESGYSRDYLAKIANKTKGELHDFTMNVLNPPVTVDDHGQNPPPGTAAPQRFLIRVSADVPAEQVAPSGAGVGGRLITKEQYIKEQIQKQTGEKVLGLVKASDQPDSPYTVTIETNHPPGTVEQLKKLKDIKSAEWLKHGQIVD
jgi:hypothetical protein